MIPIVLGSGSSIRAAILKDAGVRFQVVRPGVDEAAIKAGWEKSDGDALALAHRLAEAKALDVSQKRPEAIVIGADQILTLDDQTYDKASDLKEARERLRALRGRTHALVSGLVLAQGGCSIDYIASTSRLTMRDFSEAFLDRYLHACGDAILSSVGCYQFEGLGAQLFDRIDGDYFAILGLDRTPLLAALRRLGALDA